MTTLAEAVATSHRRAVRVRFLSADLGTVLHEVTAYDDDRYGRPQSHLLDGSVTVYRNRELPREARLSLLNETGLYTPLSASSLVWGGRVVRVERGAWVNGVARYHPLITGLITGRPTVEGGRAQTVSITLISRLKLADRPPSIALVYGRGTRLAAVVRGNLEAAGFGTADALYDLDDDGQTLEEERSFAEGSLLADTHAMCFAAGLVGPYDDGLGRALLRPWVDPLRLDAGMTLDISRTSRLLDGRWEIAADVIGPNRQVVQGQGRDGYPIHAEWRDMNPASPTYNPPDGSGPVGDIPAEIIVSPETRTQKAANALAQRMGFERGLREAIVFFEAVPNPYAADLPVFRYRASGIDVRSWPDMVTIPVAEGRMAGTLRMLRDQQGNWNVEEAA